MLWRLQSPHLSTLEFRSSPNIGQEVQDLLLGLAEGAADPSQVDRSILSRLGWCPLPSGLWWPSRPYVLCATPFRCRTPSPLRCVRPPVPGVGACISPQAPLAYVWRGAATIFGCDAPVRAASQFDVGLVDSGQGLLDPLSEPHFIFACLLCYRYYHESPAQARGEGGSHVHIELEGVGHLLGQFLDLGCRRVRCQGPSPLRVLLQVHGAWTPPKRHYDYDTSTPGRPSTGEKTG